MPSNNTPYPPLSSASVSSRSATTARVLKPLFKDASEKLHELFKDTGLSRQECKTLWDEMNRLILDQKHMLYFSQTSTAEEKAECRANILKALVFTISTWTVTTCKWSEELAHGKDKIVCFIIEQKIRGLLDQAVVCFEIGLDTFIRTGQHFFWLFRDEVSDPPEEWQNFLQIRGTPIEFR